MALMVSPAACSAVMADSRPEPGPLIRTSISFRPNFDAFSAQVSAARWAANGVLLRLPLKPTVPAEAVQSVSPLVSVMVTIVLLNVAWMCATPGLTFRRALGFLLFAMLPHLLHALLAGHGLARPLARAGVGLGPLAAHRQAAAVPHAPVAVDVPQPGDVLLHRPPQLPLDHVLAV